MAIYLKSGAGAIQYANRAWSTGEKMVPSRSDATSNVATAKKWVWECTTGGTSAATPVWPSSVTQDVTTVTDNGVVWTARKPGFSSGSTADWTFSTIYSDYAVSALAAGEDLYTSNNDAESIAGAITLNFPGTATQPNRMICVNDSAAPPTTTATTAVIATTSNNAISINGNVQIYGITFRAGTGGSAASLSIGSGVSGAGSPQLFENCNLELTNTSASSRINLGSTAASTQICDVVLKNCNVKFAAAGQSISCNRGKFTWSGGSISAGSTALTGGLFSNLGGFNSGFFFDGLIEGVNLTNMGTAANLVAVSNTTTPINLTFRNIRLPDSWSGSLTSGTLQPGYVVRMQNGDNADTNYRVWEEHYAGTIRSETTVVKTGGSTDGVTPFSIKMTSNANCSALSPLKAPSTRQYQATIGSPITVTFDFLHDSVTSLKNDQFWIEGQALTTTGFPLSSIISDGVATPMTTAANQTASSVAWTTTGLTNPNKQKAEITFTPQEKGYIETIGYLAAPSTTVYLDHVPQVS
jgi:hypothetical protein